MKKILITGALGHIGSRLIREWNEPMVLVDDLSTQRYASLFDLQRDFTFHLADITTVDWQPLLKDVYAVIHLAAATDASESHRDREKYIRINYLGTKRLADACADAGVRLFFPSTTSVYGSSEVVVKEESGLNPQCPYAESKLMAENYLKSNKDLRFVICRFGTIYGWSIGMRFHTAVNVFTWQAINNLPLTVYQTALHQKRPYLYLGDAIKAIKHIFYHDLFDQQTYNVLTGNHTVNDIVSTLKQFRDVTTTLVDSPIMNQLSYEVDDTKFRSTGFEPSGNLHAGMQEALNHLWVL
jgi:nucleoside-diphosphate-sugar epimerase